MDATTQQQLQLLRSRFPNAAATIQFVVQQSPRGAYDFIQRMYPGEFPVWTKGLEKTPHYMRQLAEFLNGKHSIAANQGKAAAWELTFFQNTNV